MAGVVVLTTGLPAMAGAASGAGQPHSVARPASGLSRLERLGRGALFHNFLAAGLQQGQLSGVDVRARADGWAVGYRCRGLCLRQYTLIEHWNGRRWSRVPSPNASRLHQLDAVQAVSARDAWAVGVYLTRTGAARTLIEHWNGRRWTRVPSPNPSAGSNGLSGLLGVTAVSSRDAWAAGLYALRNGATRPLLLRWNGVRWSTVPIPHRSGFSILVSVSATSAGSAWAVGVYGDRTSSMLLMHWNGVRWSLVPGLREQGELTSVSAVSARDVWAAGVACPDRCLSGNPPSRALLLRWNGVRWVRTASPEPGTDSLLTGVSAPSARDAWAVGLYCRAKCTQGPGLGSPPLLLRWNGTRWTRVAGPAFAPRKAEVYGISALSARRAWVVGVLCSKTCFQRSGTSRPLILGWNGRRWAS
jgi:hypothetical protein